MSSSMEPLICLVMVGVVVFLLAANYIAVTIQERRNPPQPFDPNTIDPDAAQDDFVLEYIRLGHQINAIKRYRELTGAGLKESKDAIEYMASHPDFTVKKKKKTELEVRDVGNLPDEGIREMLRNGNRLEAINTYRQFTGSSLAEAKEAIERIEIEMNQPLDDDSPSDGELPNSINLSGK